jgi:hypothetical protein
LNRITGGEVNQEEIKDNDANQQRQGVEQTAQDESQNRHLRFAIARDFRSQIANFRIRS